MSESLSASKMSVDHKSTIETNQDDLLEVLHISELLLTELCGEDVLDQRTKQNILAGGIHHEINKRFLDWLKQSQLSTFKICLEKLREDQQNHIANLLVGTPGERPLTRETRQQIRKNIRNLSEMIDVDSGLLVFLCSKRAISERERQEVDYEKVGQDKSIKLLQIILRKSDRTFEYFVDALRETNQAHIISALEKGKIIAIHADFRSASDLFNQFEEELINILEPIAQQLPYSENEEGPVDEEVLLIKQELQEICLKRIKFLKLKKGKSITIYLLCEDVEAMVELLLMFETRHLERILEEIFNLAKTSVKIPNVTIRVTLAANDLQILKEAVQLNELAQNKPQLAEKDSFSGSGGELQPPTPRIKTEAEAKLKMSKDEVPMKKLVHELENAERETERAELKRQLSMLKEKLKAIEEDNSQLRKQLQKMQNENTVLEKQLKSADAERDKIKVCFDEALKQIIEQQSQETASLNLKNLNIEDHDVFGVTYLRDNIYLLSTEYILAYQRDYPYFHNIVDDIAIAEIKSGTDISACHKTSSLYITDQGNSCVWQIKVDELKISKWLMEVGEPFLLSVTRDGRVLIPRSRPESCFDIYNSRADLLNRFLLPDKSWQPLHVVETMAGNFILSYWTGDIMEEYGICEMNSKGQVTRRPCYDAVGFESPVYMAPGNDSWVFAARPEMHSITIFEKQFFCDIITNAKEGIDYPMLHLLPKQIT